MAYFYNEDLPNKGLKTKNMIGKRRQKAFCHLLNEWWLNSVSWYCFGPNVVQILTQKKETVTRLHHLLLCGDELIGWCVNVRKATASSSLHRQLMFPALHSQPLLPVSTQVFMHKLKMQHFLQKFHTKRFLRLDSTLLSSHSTEYRYWDGEMQWKKRLSLIQKSVLEFEVCFLLTLQLQLSSAGLEASLVPHRAVILSVQVFKPDVLDHQHALLRPVPVVHLQQSASKHTPHIFQNKTTLRLPESRWTWRFIANKSSLFDPGFTLRRPAELCAIIQTQHFIIEFTKGVVDSAAC